MKTITQTVSQNENVEGHVPDEEKDKPSPPPPQKKKQLNKVEIGNFPEKEFRIMIEKMIQYLRKEIEKTQEMLTKALEEQRNK